MQIKKVIKIISLIIVYVAISFSVYYLLKLCGLDSVNKIRDKLSQFGAWAYVLFFLFQVVVSTFVCILPFEDELLVMASVVLFGTVKGFFVASFNMFVTSIIQFVIGRFFCRGLVEKFISKQSVDKYQKYLNVKGEIILPILYAIPLFPHDTLCFLAGMSKMRVWYFAIITFVMRTLEILCVCFLGCGIIDYSSFTIKDWILVINMLIIDIYLIIKLKNYIEKRIESKNNKKEID